MLEPFQLEFMQRALAAGVMAGLLASFYSPFVVQRRLAFLGSGLSHAAFGGVALGIWLGLPPLGTALPFTLLVALAMVWVRERTKLADDTAIGVFFAVSMAMGVVFLSWTRGYTSDAFTYLFGSLLAVQPMDLWIMGGAMAGTLALSPLWGRWAYATFERNLARSDRLHVLAQDCALAMCLAVVIVVGMKVVGIILASAFLVLPAATARLVSPTFRAMTLWSMLIGASSAALGLVVSYHADLPTGPAIILVQTTLFLVLAVLPLPRE